MSNINTWLSDPKRKYADGVTLFELCANSNLKKKYLEYFKSVTDASQFDVHFTMLINKLRDVKRNSKLSEQSVVISAETNSVKDRSISPMELPEDLLLKYNRIQEIVPLMACIHSELSFPMSDAERKVKATEMCDLDDERSELWNEIDTWSGRNGVTITTVKSTEEGISDAAKTELRIAQVKDNIFRSEKAMSEAIVSGKKNLEQKAKARIESYKKELSELEEKLKNGF